MFRTAAKVVLSFGVAFILSFAFGLSTLAATPTNEALAKVEVDGVKPFWMDGGVYTVHRAAGVIKIDGKLDESDWQRAGKVVLVVFNKDTKPRETSIGRLLYDDKYLYWSLEMQDSDISCVSKGNNPETPFVEEDVAELMVKPESKDPKYWPYGYWEFNATPLGAYRDFFFARRDYAPILVSLSHNSGWTAVMKVDGTVNHWEDRDKGWVVEARIPLAAFDEVARRPVAGDRWKFVFGRYNFSAYIEDGPELSSSFSTASDRFHHFEDWPYLEFGK